MHAALKRSDRVARRGRGSLAADPRLSDHFDGRRYFNPGVDTDKRLRDVVKWIVAGRRERWPRLTDYGSPAAPIAVPPDAIAVTLIGHATLLVSIDGLNLITDPIFSDRAGPFAWAGPKRVRPPAIALDELPRIDVVLLSHNHYDHMDLPTLRSLHRRDRPTIVTGLGNGDYLRRGGVDGAVELDWWDEASVHGLRITFVPAQHWSSRSALDRRRALWGGHVVAGETGRLLFAGDTGYGAHFAEIRRRLGAPDVALLPIGAYEPRWFMAAQHMNPDDAVQAHLDLDAGMSIGMHFGTFQLTDEAIDAPPRRLREACRLRGVDAERFRAPAFGETILGSAARRQAS